MGFDKTQAALERVVSLEEVKTHLRVDNDLEDAYLRVLIGAAIDFAENYTKRYIYERPIMMLFDSFPKCPLTLPRFPLQRLIRLSYQKSNGCSAVVPRAAYKSLLAVEPPLLLPIHVWPKNSKKAAGSVRVHAIAGYEKVPLSIKQAILLLCGHFYENREVMRERYVYGQEVPFSASALLYPYKVLRW